MLPASPARLPAPPSFKVRSALLLAAMALVLVLSARLVAGPAGVVLTAGLLVLGMWITPHAKPERLMRFFRAVRVEAHVMPELLGEVREMARKANLPTPPQIYVLHNPGLSALSVGTPKDSAIGLSHRVLYKLTRPQVKAIVAHEMAHIVAGDITILALSQVIARLVRTLAFVGILLALVFALTRGEAISPLALLLVCFAPLGVTLFQLALSRDREFDADQFAAQLTGDPQSLAAALQHIETDQHSVWQRLFWPMGETKIPTWLRTHPRTQDRVARLLR